MSYPLRDDTILGMLGIPMGNNDPGLVTPMGRADETGYPKPRTQPAFSMSARRAEAARALAGDGAFRASCISDKASDQLGVGIISYYGLDDVKRAIASIMANGGDQYHVVIFDNTEDDGVGDWVLDNAPQVKYIHSPQNVGCSRARNRLAEAFAALGIQRFVIQDQDVEWRADVPAIMNKVFDAYPDTGQVTVPLGLKQMGNHKWDATGLLSPPETPGMCCMYRLEAIAAGDDPELVGFCARYVLYRWDSDFSFSLGSKGYKVRVAPDAKGAVAHNHPHSGIQRNPNWHQEQLRSMQIFAERSKRYGWPSL